MPRVSWRGSSTSISVKWSTLQPWACGALGGTSSAPSRAARGARLRTSPTRSAAQPRHRLAEQRVAEVGVVVVLPRPRPPHRTRRWRRPARRPVPPGSAPTTSRRARSACPRRGRAATARSRRRTRVPGHEAADGSSSDSSPSSRQPHHEHGDEGLGDRADPVLHVGPVSARRPARPPAPPIQASAPSSSTPATTEGSRPCPWSRASRASRSMLVSVSSANASGGGQEQTRLRSPYAWSIRATGGQYLSGSTPAREDGRLARRRRGPTRRPAPARCAGRRAAGCPRRSTPPPRPGRSRADRDHRVAEPVELAEVLGLGRLDHQRAGHRERHRRRVEAVVDQPLGDVVDADAGRLGDAAQVEDALVRDQPAVAAGRAPGSARRSRAAT